MYTDEGSIRGFYWIAGIVAIGIFGTASVALASIVSGSVATSSSNKVKVTQLSINEPASVMPGDLLLANIAVAGGSEVDIKAPAGWTQILRTDNDSDLSVISYWKIASSSEPSNYLWSIDDQTHAEGGITAYSGIDQSDPIDAAIGTIGYGTSATTSPIGISSANEEVVTLYAAGVGKKANAGDYFSTPSGMTEKYDVSNTPFGPSIASDDVLQTSSTTSASRTSTITSKKPRPWVSQHIALRMSSSGQIAFDSASIGDYQEGSATRTWSHTVSGTSTVLIVCGATYNTDFTGATYDGVEMTKLEDINATAINPSVPTEYIACFGLLSPHTGKHDIVLSRSGTYLWIKGEAVSFRGVSQAHVPDEIRGDHQSGTITYLGTVHTSVNNSLGMVFAIVSDGMTKGGIGTTVRQSSPNGAMLIADSNNAWTEPGEHPLSLTANGIRDWDTILISLASAN